MKAICITLLLLFYYTPGMCQLSAYEPSMNDIRAVDNLIIKSEDIDIHSISPKKIFSKIEIADFRYDTTNIGLWAGVNKNPFTFGNMIDNRKINFKNGLSDFLKNTLTEIYLSKDTTNNISLICFIKQFNTTKRDTLTENLNRNENYGQLKVEIECYYGLNTKYYPALKMDTTIINTLNVFKKEFSESFADSLVESFLNILIRKIDKVDINKVVKRLAYSRKDLFIKYGQRFELPILKANYVKGVYTNFTEFKNNNPSIKEFTIEEERYNSTSLIDENGNIITATKMYAYGDGKKMWIRFGNFSFRLFRVGNGFEFFIVIKKNIMLLVQINMDQGKPY